MGKFASILVVLLTLYVGAYFACVRPLTICFGHWYTGYPVYSGFSACHLDTLFSPIHQIDRQYLRPSTWARPMTVEEATEIADLALKHAQNALRAPSSND